ncbi:CbiX/SirB N-terminal domain-containing protein [Cohaesibacter celericrescens]|uniref:CbiX/SirB N-terminal domain-containing protein n=1 Tax=Cohaesibacter celericrescens TaxID=2067669 RepID=UPI00356528C5
MQHLTPDSADLGILIVAHGERGGRFDNARVLELADEVRNNIGNVQVEAGVLKGSPSISDAWTRLKSSHKLIYPFFMSDGYFCNRILPRKLAQEIDHSIDALTMLPPFGVSEWLANCVTSALLQDIEQLGLKGTRPPLLIAAHGASIDKQSSKRTRQLADKLKRTGNFGRISCGFLDEAPHLSDMIGEVLPNTVVLPLFNGLGSHSVDDMAKLAKSAPESCHFVTPVGGQSWVGDIMTADILKALHWWGAAEAAE